MANKKATVGRGAPVMGLTNYLQAFPRALVQDSQGRQLSVGQNGIQVKDGSTVGAPPIGTGMDGQLLEVPKIVPAVGNLALPNTIPEPAVPYTTALPLNSTFTFTFQLRSNPYGPMMVKGFYALAFTEEGEVLDLRNGGHTIEIAF